MLAGALAGVVTKRWIGSDRDPVGPPHYAKPWVDGGLMMRIDPARYATHLDFDIVTRKNAEPTRVVQAFRACLIAAVGASMWTI